MTITHEATISAALSNRDVRDANRLYEAALAVASLPCLFSPAVLRVVSDKLAEESNGTTLEPHERDVLAAMAFFLSMEAAAR